MKTRDFIRVMIPDLNNVTPIEDKLILHSRGIKSLIQGHLTLSYLVSSHWLGSVPLRLIAPLRLPALPEPFLRRKDELKLHFLPESYCGIDIVLAFQTEDALLAYLLCIFRFVEVPTSRDHAVAGEEYLDIDSHRRPANHMRTIHRRRELHAQTQSLPRPERVGEGQTALVVVDEPRAVVAVHAQAAAVPAGHSEGRVRPSYVTYSEGDLAMVVRR